jgi:hypothetical protein
MASEASPDEQLHASAVRFLIEGGEDVAASVLLSCSLNSSDASRFWTEIKLTCPRAAYDILTEYEHPIRVAVENALRAFYSGKKA